jgi:EpsD family peptidyl-prolyl cis-trans isomerase
MVLGTLTLLTSCSRSDSAGITQAVAKVNKEEITELQVNQVLERQRGLKPEQVEAASQRAVVALVDQEIVYQKARELKLDREPRVVQGIEAAKRELISRAYLERVAEGAAAPTPEDVRIYYDGKPALFKERRIYNLQELTVEAAPEQRAELESQLKALKSPAELQAFLKERQLRVRNERSTVAAENLPLALVERLAAVKPGTGIVLPAADGVRLILVIAIQDAPVTLEQARPAIEVFLSNDRKRQAIDKEMQSLRSSATITYLGKFKGLPASATAGMASPAASSPALELPAAAPGASSAMDSATTSKGLSGLK